MSVKISEKQLKCYLESLERKDIIKDIDSYKICFDVLEEIEIKDFRFFVLSEKEFDLNKKYNIFGINFMIFSAPGLKVRYVHEVELLEDEIYYQNNRACAIFGKVKLLKTYKTKFKYSDYEKGKNKNTFLDLIDSIGIDNFSRLIVLEAFALSTGSKDLLSNVIKYKGKTFLDNNAEIRRIKHLFINNIDVTNKNKLFILKELEAVNSKDDLLDFLERNKYKYGLDGEDDKILYQMDDVLNIGITPILTTRDANIDFSDNEKRFNMALPFYFQYKNYQHSTLILKDFIEKEFEKNGYKDFYCKYFDFKLYGLYYPILMSFRQSVELVFKLIFINEILKKRSLEEINASNDKEKIDFLIYENAFSNKSIKEVSLKTHNLLSLLSFIRPCIKDKEYLEFLYDLSNFIYFTEHTDASYSRYIIDASLTKKNLYREEVRFETLIKYIDEFYPIMDEILSDFNFNFNLKSVFAQ